jgi:chemotaxis protein MotB
MAAQSNMAPVIIKRKKVVGGDGHHGGAWKVAYADFVTAMMAFFMLMWLLNATTEKQRKGLADYFSPTIPISRVSGGGEGAFAGNSVFSQDTLPHDGTGASNERATDAQLAKGDTGLDPSRMESALNDELRSIEQELKGRSGESMLSDQMARHIITRVTDEGLSIELFEAGDNRLFQTGTDQPTQLLRDLMTIVSRVSGRVTNSVAAEAHIRSHPIVLAQNPVWDLTTARAHTVRLLLEQNDMPAGRIQRVTGHADRELVSPDPMDIRNNRVEVILLRD